MWSRLFTTETADSADNETEEVEPQNPSVERPEEELVQKNLIIDQLKSLLRENEAQLQEKNKDFSDLSAKLQRFQIQSKAKIASLTNQLKDKPPKKDEGEFDDTSSSDSSEYGSRGKVILLRKQLETSKQQLDKSEKENKLTFERFTQRVKDLEQQLSEKTDLVTSLSMKEEESDSDTKAPQGSNVNEMYAQVVYKDSKILDLNNQILEQERRIIDLQEHIREKDEVLQTRNLAVQLMSADMSRKGKSVVDELEETRQQMKIMQSNFADVELEWKTKYDSLNAVIETFKFESEHLCAEKESAISALDSSLKKTEAARYELAAKNAELQKRIVLAEEKTEKQFESYRKQFEERNQALEKELIQEKSQSAELKKALSESTNQSESKILKARVKERTKLKALERELAALKSLQQKEQKTEDVTQLQQQVAVLEEEKGTLQLRLIEVDEQISAQDDLKLQYSDLQLLLKEKEDIILNLEEKARLEKDEKEVLMAKIQEKDASNNKLKQDYEEANNLNMSLGTDIQEIITAKETFENNVNLLEEKNEELMSQNQELSEEVNSLKDMNISLNMKVIQLEELIEGEKQEKNEINNKLREMQEDNSSEYSLREENRKLQSMCSELSESLQSVKTCDQEKQRQIEKLNEDLQQISSEFENAQSKNIDFEAKISTLSSKIEDMDKCLKDQENEKTKLQKEKIEYEENLSKVLFISSTKDVAQFEEIWNSQLLDSEKYKKEYENALEQQQNLEANLQHKTEEIQSHNTTIMELNSQLERNHAQYEKEKDFINENLKQVSEMKNKLENSMHKANNQLAQLSSVIQDKEENLHSLSVTLQKKINIMSLLEQDKITANNEIGKLKTTLNNEVEKTKARINSLLEQISDLEMEVSRQNEEIVTRCEKESLYETKLQALTLEIQDAVEKGKTRKEADQYSLSEKEKHVQQLQEQISLLENNLLKREQNLEELKKTKDVFALEISDLRQIVETAKECNEKLESSMNFQLSQQKETHAKELKNSENKISMLDDQINTYKQQVISLQQVILSSELSSSEKENVNKTLLEENMRLKLDCGKLESQEKVMKDSLQELTQETSNLKDQCENLFQEKKDLLSSNKALQKDTSVLEDAISKLKEDIIQKGDEFSEINQLNELKIRQQQETMTSLQSSLDNALETVKQKDIKLEDLVVKLENSEVNSRTFENEVKSLSASLNEKELETEKHRDLAKSSHRELLEIKAGLSKRVDLKEHLWKILHDNGCLNHPCFDPSYVDLFENRKVEDIMRDIVVALDYSEREQALCKEELMLTEKDFEEREKEKQKTINTLQTNLKATQKAFKANEEAFEDCVEKLKAAENSNRIYEEGMKRVLANAKTKARELVSSERMVTALKKEVEFLRESSSKALLKLHNTIVAALERKQELEVSLATATEKINSLTEKEAMLEETNSSLVESNCKLKNYLVDSGISANDDCTFEEALHKHIEEVVTFKKECFELFDENLPINIEATISSDKEEQGSIINGLQKRIYRLWQSREELNQGVQRLTDQNKALSLDESGVKNQYSKLQTDNEHLIKELYTCRLGFRDISSKISNMEETNLQNLSNALSKFNIVYHDVEKLSSFKEKIQRGYISHKDHEYQMKRIHEAHKEEVEAMKKYTEDEQHLMAEAIRTLKTDIDEKNQQLEAANEQLDINCQSLDTLSERVKLLEEQNEQLSTGIVANRENYSNDFVTLHRKLSNAYSTISFLRTEITEIRSIHEQLQHQQLNEFHSAAAAVTNLQNEMEVLNTNLIKTVKENKDLKIHMEELIRQLHGQETYFSSEVADLTSVNSLLTERLEKRSKVVEEQKSKIKTEHEEIERLQLDLKTSEKTCDSLQKYSDECKLELEDICRKYCSTKDLIHNVNTYLDIGTPSESDLTALSELKKDTNIFEDEFSACLKQFLHSILFNIVSRKELSNDVNRYQSEVQQLASTISTLTEKLSNVSSETTEANAELSILRNAVKMVQKTDVESPVIARDILVTASSDSEKQSSAKNLVTSSEVVNIKETITELNEKIHSLTTAYQLESEKSLHLQQQLTLAKTTYTQLHDEYKQFKQNMEKTESALLASRDKWKNEFSILKSSQGELQELYDKKSMEVQQHKNMIQQLELKIQADETSISTLMASCKEAQNKSELLSLAKHDLENRFRSMQEHADMLMSDNETYQDLVEKLKMAKLTIEKELHSMSDQSNEQIKWYEFELKKQTDLITETNHTFQAYRIEQEKKNQSFLSSRDQLESMFQEAKSQCQVLESEKVSMRKEFEHMKIESEVQTATLPVQQSLVMLATSSQTGDLLGIEQYQNQIDSLTKDLLSSRNALQEWQKAEHLWKEQYANMELHFQQTILNLQQQLSIAKNSLNSASYNQLQEVNKRLDLELQQALSSLHKQNARSEELNMELSKLIDERNSTKQRLSNFQQQVHAEYQDHARENVSLLRSSPPLSDNVKVPVPSENDHMNLQVTQSQSEIAKLHQRLQETEKICKELRKANEALDGKLIVEREQRQLVEEELGFAQRQLMPKDKSNKDEYRILLDDFEEPEMFVETNFSITRKVQGHAHKVRRWLRGRRLYMHKLCQRRNYSELLYILYLWALNFWFVWCITQH